MMADPPAAGSTRRTSAAAAARVAALADAVGGGAARSAGRADRGDRGHLRRCPRSSRPSRRATTRASSRAAGGGEAFRAAVVGGNAPVHLARGSRAHLGRHQQDASRTIRSTTAPRRWCCPTTCAASKGASLRPDAASALTEHGRRRARRPAWARSRMESGFRSYSTQQSSYGTQVSRPRRRRCRPRQRATRATASTSPGITADVVACNGGCGTLDDLAAIAAGRVARGARVGVRLDRRATRTATPTPRDTCPSRGTCATSGRSSRARTTTASGTRSRSSSACPPAPAYLG